MELNIWRTILLGLIIISEVAFVFFKGKIKVENRLCYLFTSIGIIIYSGISTLYVGLCEDYFVWFILYFSAFTFGFICINFSRKQSMIRKIDTVSYTEKKYSDSFLKMMVFWYFSYLAVQYVYPTNRLGNIFNLSFSLTDVFNNGVASENAVYSLFY